MADLAEIGFSADTTDLARAREALEALQPAGQRADDAAARLAGAFDRTNVRAKALSATIGKVGGVLRTFAAGAAGFVSGVLASFSFDQIISGARELSNASAVLATNLTAGSGELEKFTAAASNMADVFGTTVAFQLRALYDTVSAGISDISSATSLVDTANRLAVGGLSNVGTAVDVLTTIVNSYQKTGYTAAEASDALFIAMKAGKTTVDELATQMGQIVPIASALGVGFDELTAGLAALTLSGLNTSQATTGLRAILSAVAKPTSEAAKLAKQLGIDFNSAALQSKGLAQFLRDVVKGSGGSNDALAILFGTVEALNAALAFAGVAGDNFADILDQMRNKAGATKTAYDAIAQSLDKRLGIVVQRVGNAATAFGSAILAVVVPLGEVLTGVASMPQPLQAVAAAMIAAFGPVVLASVLSLTTSLAVGLVNAIRAVGVALAILALSNPFTAILQGALAVAGVLYVYSERFRAVVDSLASHIKNAFVVGYQVVLQTWSSLPAVFADLGIQAANAVLRAFGAPEMTNAYAGAAQSIMDTIAKVIDDNRPRLQLTINGNQPRPATGSTAPANDNVANIVNLGDAEKQKTALEKISAEIEKMATPVTQATAAYQALRDALWNGVVTGEQYAEILSRIQTAFGNAGGTVSQWNMIVNPNAEGLKAVGEEVKSIVSDIKSGIRQGDSLWQSFANAGLNAMDRLIDKWTNEVLDTLFNPSNLKDGGGFSNLLDGILGLFGGTTKAAKGKVFQFANGGAFTNSVVDRPTLFRFANGSKFGEMGEAGPEAVMPLKRGPNGSLGVQMYGNNGGGRGGDTISYAPSYTLEAGVSAEEFAQFRRVVEEDQRNFARKVMTVRTESARRNIKGY